MKVKAALLLRATPPPLQGRRNKVKTVIHLICVLMTNTSFSLVSVSLVMMMVSLYPFLCIFFYSTLSILVNADAPHLSLLIKNKAKAALLLTITAPSFVRLETNKVQLPESQDTKVTFSFIFEWLHGGRLNLVNLLRQAYIFVLFFFGR